MENDEPKPWQAWLARMQAHRGLRLLGSLAVAAVGIYALYVMAGHVTWSEVKADLQSVPGSVLAWAILAATLSFAALGAYDVLSVNSMAPKRVPSWVSLLTGASGYAISNLLGASWLTGTGVWRFCWFWAGFCCGSVAARAGFGWRARPITCPVCSLPWR
jgi:phosphatidylglycerol lysyltransferase